MAADNQVVLEGIAKFEALQRAVQQLVADAEGQLGKLGRNHPLVVDVAAAQVSVDRVLSALRRTRDEAGAPKVLRVRTEDAETRVAALSAQVKQLGVAVTDFGPPDPLGKFRGSVNQAGAAVSDFVARTTAGSAKFGQGFDQAATRSKLALESLQREIRDTAAAGSPIPPAVVAQVDRLETEYRQATTAAHQFRVAQAQVREGIRSATPPINDLNASLGRVVSTVKSFLVAAAVNELRQLGGESFTVSERLKAIDRQLEAALGSSEKAAEGFAFVKAESDRLGFGLLGAVDAYARLSSAARGTSLEGEGINRVFTQFAERATVARLSSEDFAGVIRALEQIISKGTLSMEELRQQLGDRLPGTLRLAGKALGFSEGQFKALFDLVKSNSVSSIEFIQLFGNIVQKEIAEQVPEASKAATAEVNRLSNAWLLAKKAAGDELSPAVGELAKDLVGLLKDGEPVLKLVGAITGGFITLARVGLTSATATRDALQAIGAGFQGILAAVVPGGAGFGDFFDVASERIQHAKLALDRLQKSLFDTEPPAAAAAASVDDLAGSIDFAARKMDGAINEIIEYAAEVEKSGNVQRAEADKIVKAVDKQLKAIRELPGAEGAAFKVREAQLLALRDRFFEFTTAYEEEQEKQAKAAEKQTKKEAAEFKKREDQFLSFLVRLREIAAGVEASGGGAAAEALAGARAELEGIESKEFLDPEDLNRVDDLRQQIRELEQDASRGASAVRDIGTAASDAATEQRRALGEFVAENEDFRAAFLELSPIVQRAVQELVTGFERTAQAQGANVAETDLFLSSLVALFSQGGQLAQSFAERLAVATGTARDSGVAFNALWGQALEAGDRLNESFNPALVATNEALKATGPAGAAAADGLREVSAAAQEVVGFSPNLIEGAARQGEGLIRVSRAAADTAGAYANLQRASEAVVDSSESATAGVIAFGDKTVILQKQSEDTGGTLTTFGGVVHDLKGKGEEAGEGLAKGAEGAAKLADGTEKATAAAGSAKEELAGLGDAAGKAGAAAADGAKGVGDLGTAAGAAVEPMGALAERVKAVTGVDLPKFFGDTADQVGRAAESATDLATGVGKIEAAATEGDPELQTLRDRGGEIAQRWGDADRAVAGFNERASIAIGLCKELHECLAGLAAS